MKFKILMMFSLLMLINAPAYAVKSELISPEIGVITGFYLSKNLTGYVNFKECEKCKVKRYKITPSIKAYLNYKEVPLSSALLMNKPEALVLVRASGELAGLKWYSNKKNR